MCLLLDCSLLMFNTVTVSNAHSLAFVFMLLPVPFQVVIMDHAESHRGCKIPWAGTWRRSGRARCFSRGCSGEVSFFKFFYFLGSCSSCRYILLAVDRGTSTAMWG